QPPKRRIDDGISNRHAYAALVICGSRHAKLWCCPLIKPAARTVSGVEHRFGHACRITQRPSHLPHAAGFGVLTRRQADEPLERSLEVIRAAADASGKCCERRVPFDVRQVDACSADFVDPWIDDASGSWQTSLAGPISAAFGLVRAW